MNKFISHDLHVFLVDLSYKLTCKMRSSSSCIDVYCDVTDRIADLGFQSELLENIDIILDINGIKEDFKNEHGFYPQRLQMVRTTQRYDGMGQPYNKSIQFQFDGIIMRYWLTEEKYKIFSKYLR